VLQCVLQRGTVRRCVLQCVDIVYIQHKKVNVLQCCSVCFNDAQCVAVCCSVLQCVAMCCGVVTWFVFSKESRCVALQHKGMAF